MKASNAAFTNRLGFPGSSVEPTRADISGGLLCFNGDFQMTAEALKARKTPAEILLRKLCLGELKDAENIEGGHRAPRWKRDKKKSKRRK
jgi:hypothetical protein